MEERYRAGLDIIKAMCERENYIDTAKILVVCNTIMGESEDNEDGNVCAG